MSRPLHARALLVATLVAAAAWDGPANAQPQLAPMPEPQRASESGTADPPERTPIHDRVRVWVGAHAGVPVGVAVDVDGRPAAHDGSSFPTGGSLGVEVPISRHFSVTGAGRYTTWRLGWEERAGLPEHPLFEVVAAPKVGGTVGRGQILQLYARAPLGVAIGPGAERELEVMRVSSSTAVGPTLGVVGGIQVLFGRLPLGFMGEVGPRWAWLPQRYDYRPAGGASFAPASEDVTYSMVWVFAQAGLFLGFE